MDGEPIQELRDMILQEYPQYRITMDVPSKPGGAWWLDVLNSNGDILVTIAWQSQRGFGISRGDSHAEYGEGHETVVETLTAARATVFAILSPKSRLRLVKPDTE